MCLSRISEGTITYRKYVGFAGGLGGKVACRQHNYPVVGGLQRDILLYDVNTQHHKRLNIAKFDNLMLLSFIGKDFC